MPFHVECMFVFIQRIMLGSMQDPTANILAIMIMAIEECVMRSTMAWRDTVLSEFLGKPKLTGAKLQMRKFERN